MEPQEVACHLQKTCFNPHSLCPKTVSYTHLDVYKRQPLKAVSIAGDKVKTKEFLLKNNIKTPEHELIHSYFKPLMK